MKLSRPQSIWNSFLGPNSLPSLLVVLISLLLTLITPVTIDSAEAAKRQATTRYEVKMPKPYQPKGLNGGFDDYRCFLIDPKVKTNSILTTIEFIPQTKAVVHHAILFRVPAAQIAAAQEIDPEQDGWSCFGGSGIGTMFQSFVNTPWLSAWVPGRNRDVAPKGYGYPFNKGDQIVLQVHYNLLAANSGKQTTDQSRIV